MSLTMMPPGRPQLTVDELSSKTEQFNIDRQKYPLICVGIRGYYANTLGEQGNDRGIYDDAIFLHSSKIFLAFNGNTDPSVFRKGAGTGSGKGIASLVPGAYYVHKLDMHNGKYLALCQRAGNVTVIRDGNPPYQDTGMFGINIHKGGYNTTGSEGCQTLHPDQWGQFIAAVVSELKRFRAGNYKSQIVPYILIG